MVHSMTFFVDVDLNDPMKIINQGNRPILELGKPGTFDEDGIMSNFCYWRENAPLCNMGVESKKPVSIVIGQV